MISHVQLQDFFNNLAHKPYCSSDLGFGLRIRSKQIAIKMQYIQGNQPCMLHYFFFDIDRPEAVMAWHDENLPKPYWTAQNPRNGHAHICYKLEIPLCTSEFGSQKAIAYASKVQAGLANKLGADVGYSHLITKNPFHKDWRIEFWTEHCYTLDYLADFVDLPKKLSKKQEQLGLGRNCTLFNTARKWAYKAVRDYFHHHSSLDWEKAVLSHISALNSEFEIPLPYSELRATAKSISNYCWKKFSYGGFSEWQSKNAERANVKGACSLGGKARSHQYDELRMMAKELEAQGVNKTQIANTLKVSRPTIIKWLNGV